MVISQPAQSMLGTVRTTVFIGFPFCDVTNCSQDQATKHARIEAFVDQGQPHQDDERRRSSLHPPSPRPQYEAPRKEMAKINSPMVSAKTRNAPKPSQNPPTPVATTATAARKGAVQPTPTKTNPAPTR